MDIAESVIGDWRIYAIEQIMQDAIKSSPALVRKEHF
jgi:hypothetical protein